MKFAQAILFLLFVSLILPACVDSKPKATGAASGSAATSTTQAPPAKNPIDEKKLKALLLNTTKTVDKMEGITWYHAKIGDLLSISDAKIRYGKSINKTVDVLSSYGESEALLKYSSGLRLYIGKTASRTWMRLKITFTGRTWLFIENYKFLLDGETYELPVGFDDVKRKTESEGVREITDTVVSHDLLPLVQTIAKAKKATVRFRGRDEFMERTITKAEKDAFKQMLELFNAFGGKID